MSDDHAAADDVHDTRVREVFDRAIATAREQRADLLTRECLSDTEMYRRIEAMLVEAEGGDPFRAADSAALQGGAHANASLTAPLTPPKTRWLGEQPGSHIGQYKLLQAIGEGGFGSVYLAEQEHPVRRRVALKIIKLGMDTRQVIARFEAERQALAMMDHPNIARVFDAGATDSGRPYFVMELVRGDPITHYCDTHNLSTAERLALFQDVCRAVQHAHTKGVIHRDIKPSNVLVTVADGRAIPKVIDFGIAKATGVRLTDKTFFTEHRTLIGTPEYMSPEQAEMSGVDIDTRSDVYSLGVLLYVLLTGTTPFASETLRAAPYGEMQRIIRENDPPRPSTRLSTMGEDLATVAAHRQTEPHKLRKMVRGDLDWIVMRAMEKDRTRRYETASSLAEDVQRHLSGEAVLAAPPSAAYRLRKFARRNRAGVLVGSIVAFALVLGVIGTSLGLARALREKGRADVAATRARLAAEQESTAKQQAQAEALRAKAAEEAAEARAAELAQVARFQSSMLSDIDVALMGDRLREDVLAEAALQLTRLNLPPAETEARRAAFEQAISGLNFTNPAVTSLERNVLQRALSAIDEQFADQPLVQARLLHTIADVLQSLGRLDSALQPLERAVEIRRRTLGNDHVDTLDSIGNLATIFDDAGNRERAGPLYQEALDGYRRTLGEEHPQTLTAMSNYGYWLDMQGRAEEAEPLHRTVLEARRRVLGPEHEHTLISAVNLGVLLRTQGRLDEAEPLYREALEGYRKVLGDEHPWTLAAMNNMAFLLAAKGELEQAEHLHREALATRRRVLGDNHPHTQQSVYALGKLLRTNKRLTEAEALYREGLQASRATLGDDDPETLIDMQRLASLLGEMEKFSEADTLYHEAIERSARIHGPAHAETLTARAEFCAIRLTALQRDATLGDTERHAVLQEIESLLLEGLDDENTAAASEALTAKRREAIQRLIDLFEASNQPDSAARWRSRLDEATPASTQPSANTP